MSGVNAVFVLAFHVFFTLTGLYGGFLQIAIGGEDPWGPAGMGVAFLLFYFVAPIWLVLGILTLIFLISGMVASRKGEEFGAARKGYSAEFVYLGVILQIAGYFLGPFALGDGGGILLVIIAPAMITLGVISSLVALLVHRTRG